MEVAVREKNRDALSASWKTTRSLYDSGAGAQVKTRTADQNAKIQALLRPSAIVKRETTAPFAERGRSVRRRRTRVQYGPC